MMKRNLIFEYFSDSSEIVTLTLTFFFLLLFLCLYPPPSAFVYIFKHRMTRWENSLYVFCVIY